MGDRCPVYFNEFDERGERLIVEMFGEPDENYRGEAPCDAPQFVYYEINYAGTDELIAMAKANPDLALIGMHGDGDEYQAHAFVVNDGAYRDWPLDYARSYVLTSDPDDRVDREGIEEQIHVLEAFLAERAKVIKKLGR